MCTVDASAEYFSLNLWTLFLRPLVLQYFQLCADSACDFLEALDDEEFFVVEGSGVAGSPGVSLPGDLSPTSHSDSLHR